MGIIDNIRKNMITNKKLVGFIFTFITLLYFLEFIENWYF